MYTLYSMEQLFVFGIILGITHATTATHCKPHLTEINSKSYVGGSIYTKCDVSTCARVAKVVYVKTVDGQLYDWKHVYEGISRTNHTALTTDTGYTIEKRNAYTTLSNLHYLEIKDLKLTDNGNWKCLAIEHNKWYESNAISVNIQESGHCSVTLHVNDISPTKGGTLFIDCIVSHCDDITKFQFERKSVRSNKWIAVYEYINKTSHKEINTLTNVSLLNRTNASELSPRYTLKIEPIILQDQGEWRCAFYGSKPMPYRSNILYINVFVIPDALPIIKPHNPTIVTKQAREFTCQVQSIHPEPMVRWIVNGEQYTQGQIDNTQSDNGLWSVKNTIGLTFDDVGKVDVECIMTTGDTDNMTETDIQFEIKEAARVIYPTHDITRGINSVLDFTLTCSGTGYNHHIMWRRNGMTIKQHDKYIIHEFDNSDNIFTSTISATTTNEKYQNIHEYTGVYTCVVELASPYNSSAISPDFIITAADSSAVQEIAGNFTFYRADKRTFLLCNICKWDAPGEEWYCKNTSIRDINNTYSHNSDVKRDISESVCVNYKWCIVMFDETGTCTVYVAQELPGIVITELLVYGVLTAVVLFIFVNNMICCCIIRYLRVKLEKMNYYYYNYKQTIRVNQPYENIPEEDILSSVHQDHNRAIVTAAIEPLEGAMYDEIY